MIQHKSEGRLPFIQITNCGCGNDKKYPRIGIFANDKVDIFAFGTERPCCAYALTDIMETAAMLNRLPVFYLEVQSYMDKFDVVSRNKKKIVTKHIKNTVL